MKQNYLKTILCMLMLCVGMSAWAESKTLTLTIADVIDGKTGTVTLDVNKYGSQAVATKTTWYTFAKDDFSFSGARICKAAADNGSVIQLQGNASDAAKQGFVGNTTSFTQITNVKITARTTESSTYTPNFNVYVGSSELPSSSALTIPEVTPTTAGGFKTYVYNMTVSGTNGYFAIRNNLAGALYIDEIAITYNPTAVSKTATTTTFGGEETYKIYQGDSFAAPTATVTGGAGLAATYSSSNTAVATVNATTGAVTVVGPGKTTITASYAGDATYESSNDSYELTVVPVYSSLEALVAADLTSGTTVKVTFSDMEIKSIYLSGEYRNGIYFDIQKDEKDIEIYYQNVPEAWVVGGTVSGTMECAWTQYKGTWELAPTKDTWDWANLTYTAPEVSATITIGEAGYATYYNSKKAYKLPTGVSGYVAFIDAAAGNKFTFDEAYESGKIVPANEALVLKAAPGTYTLTFTNDTPEESFREAGMNDLKGTDVAADTEGGDGYHYYMLSLNAANELSSVGFYFQNEGGKAFLNGAHKAYLAYTAEQVGSVKEFRFNDYETGVQDVDVDENADQTIYDLSGRKVSNAQKGIYIKNGRKFMK